MAKHETVGSTSWNTIWKRAWGLRVVMGTVLFTALFSLWCGVGSGATNSRPLALSGRLSSGVTHNAGNGNISVQAASKGHRLLLANGFPIPTPGGTPDGTPGGTPGGTPSGTPDGTPSGTPGGTPGPTVTPGPTATPLPTATPGVIPTPTPACSCGASDSSSQLRLYKDDNGELGDEVSAGSTTGGKLWGVLELTVGTCGRVDASPAPTPLPGTNPTPAPTPGDIQNVTVRLTENPDTVNNVTHPFKQNHVDIPISLVNTTGWEKEMPADESHDEPYWVPGNPKDASTDKPHPYRYKFLWQTTAPQILADLSPTPTPGSPAATPAPDDPPAGNTKLYDHNGSHTMSLVAVNGDYTKTHLRFQKMQDDGTWGDPYEAGPSDLGTDVENLVITDVSSNNGTVDYFKWDPASQNQALGNPNISFKIKDLGDPHKYKWIIWFNETSKVHTDTASDWTSSAYKVTGTVDNPQVVTVDLTDANLSGHLDPEVHPSGPYTYDIRVLEYDSNPPTDDAGTGALDKAQFKQPYNEWIPYQFQDGQTSSPGHEVWTAFPDPDTNSNSGDLELRANYYLFPNSSTNNLGANTINMIPMDPALTERTPVPGPTTPGVLHGGDQGLLAYNITSADPDGDWRVIFTGDDASGPISRRTHDFQRIIAINAKGPARSMIPFSTENSNNVVSGNGWYAVWLYAPRVLKKTVYHWQGARTVDSWMNDFVQSNSYSSEWAVMNGGYYDVGAPNEKWVEDTRKSIIGSVGSQSNSAGYNWTDGVPPARNGQYYQRWAFGMKAPWRWTQGSDFNIGLMSPSSPGYIVPNSISGNYPYGLSALLCLLQNGIPQVRLANTADPVADVVNNIYIAPPHQGWENSGLEFYGPTYTHHSAVAWTQDERHVFFLIHHHPTSALDTTNLLALHSAEGSYQGDGAVLQKFRAIYQGLQIGKQRPLIQGQLPARIRNAMMLDGGHSSSIEYRRRNPAPPGGTVTWDRIGCWISRSTTPNQPPMPTMLQAEGLH